MLLKFAILLATALFNSSLALPDPGNANHAGPSNKCLTETEAWSIATRWLSIFSTGGVTSEAQLATIVAPNLYSVDDTFGPPTTTIDELWDDISAGGNTTVTDVKQYPLFLIHSCDGIAVRWQYEGVTTGWNSTVPAGTNVAFKGNDILKVDLGSRLLVNATSSGDWILLAQQLGTPCYV